MLEINPNFTLTAYSAYLPHSQQANHVKGLATICQAELPDSGQPRATLPRGGLRARTGRLPFSAPIAMPDPTSSPQRVLDHYATMCRIRAFERMVIRGTEEDLVKGAAHLSIGQEAVAAAVCGNLRRSDQIASNHRGHGHTIAKGADPEAMMRELFGREGGICGGKGGSMHIAEFDVGMLGANGIVGAGILIALGAAKSKKMLGTTDIVVCFFGDGAVNRGPFLEGLNWARVFDLPVLFVCEDNKYAATTRTDQLTGGPGPASRAESLGIPARSADGNDLIGLDATVRRPGRGDPWRKRSAILACRNLPSYWPYCCRSGDLSSECRSRGGESPRPIGRAKAFLMNEGTSESDLDRIAEDAEREMTVAFETARDAPVAGPVGRRVRRTGHRRAVMSTKTYSDAGKMALAECMRADPTIWAVGEDLGRGGVFGQYMGLEKSSGRSGSSPPRFLRRL